MKKIFRLIGVMLGIYLLGLGLSAPRQLMPVHAPDLHSEQNAQFTAPDEAPLFFLNRENVNPRLFTDHNRFQSQSLFRGYVAPPDYQFCIRIRSTFHLKDHEAPVPVFIRGHALLC